MSISPKNSIGKVSLGKNSVKGNSGGINHAIKSSTQVAKSTQTNGSTSESSQTNDSGDDAEVSTDEEGKTWEAGKPISEGADEAAAKTTKALYSGYWDFKTKELEIQRGTQQDQLAFQKAQAEAQAQQIQSQQGLGLASQAIGGGLAALGQIGQAMGSRGGGSGGGSSGGGSPSGAHRRLAQDEAKAFEDQKKTVKVDAKGNPIIEDPSKVHGTHALKEGQQLTQTGTPESQETTFQTRPVDHGQMQIADVQAQSYDPENSMTIEAHLDMRGSQTDDLNLELAQNETSAEIESFEEVEPEIPEIEIDFEEEEIA